MHAHHVRHPPHPAPGRHHVRRHVRDAPQAVAPEAQRVGARAGAVVAQVEGGLARVRRARVGVGDEHLGEGEAVEEGAVGEAHVVQGQAFAVVEAEAEGPG